MMMPDQAFAATDGQEARLTIRGSDLKVPRFVALKSDDVNMRAGPGLEYPVTWHYQRMGLPLRVEAEFEVWRKVVDHRVTPGGCISRSCHYAVLPWLLMGLRESCKTQR